MIRIQDLGVRLELGPLWACDRGVSHRNMIPVKNSLCAVLLDVSESVHGSQWTFSCLFVVSSHAPTGSRSPRMISFAMKRAYDRRCDRCSWFQRTLNKLVEKAQYVRGQFSVLSHHSCRQDRLIQIRSDHGLLIAITSFRHQTERRLTWRFPLPSKP